MMTTIKLDDGKYEFDIDDQTGLMTAARRHGEPWEAGFEQRFSKAFMAALWRVRDLEASAIQATRDSALALAECAQEGLRALSTAVQQSANTTPQADAAPNTASERAFLSELEWCIAEGNHGPRTLAALKHARAVLGAPSIDAAIAAGGAQEPVKMSADECAQDVYEHGKSIGLFDIPKETANAICAGISAATGATVDWHYIAGRVHMKALPREAATVGLTDERGEQVRLKQWQGGAGLLWDVYAFGKWHHRIVIDWDAHTVYLDMQRAGYAEHIELRLVSSSNNANPDEPQAAAPAAAANGEQ